MEPTPAPQVRRLEQAGVDDLVAFGAYPQSGGGRAEEPIRWRVLDRSDGGLLLLSDRILECRRYHRELAETTWRDYDLRAWLNGAFCSAAFGDEERRLIRSTPCAHNGPDTPDTVDDVFLLSERAVRTLTDRSPGQPPAPYRTDIPEGASDPNTEMSRDLPVPKASTESVARAIFDGVQAGEDDIFPDPISETLAERWRTGPVKQMERQNAALVAAEPTAA
jgi:hypothetical protein